MENQCTSLKAQRQGDTILKQFSPLVAQYGFAKPQWDCDPKLDIVRVQFERPREGRRIQIDYYMQADAYSANYCRAEGEWQICAEGKRTSLGALTASLPRWIVEHCRECSPESEEEEDEV
jgi:hypothetical protein